MRYELTVVADTHEELVEFINKGLPKPIKAKVKTSQAAKANAKEKTPAPKEEPKPEPEPEPESKPEDNGKPELTLKAVKKVMADTVTRIGDPTPVRDTLVGLGVEKISDLDESLFSEYVEKLEAL